MGLGQSPSPSPSPSPSQSPSQGAEAFDRSREHRRGVREASADLEQALARPAGRDPEQWPAATAASLRDLSDAFRHHAEQSEGDNGLLKEIVTSAPRLAHAVNEVKREHEVLLAEMARLVAASEDPDAGSQIDQTRQDALSLLQRLAAHRQQGADLIYEAYSVDLEGGEGG